MSDGEKIQTLLEAVEYLIELAKAAMISANNSGAEYDIKAELREYKQLLKECK